MIDTLLLVVPFVFLGIVFLGVLGYLAACAGAERWLTLRKWWGSKK